jgi:NADH-quinone oxidoreductase subunit J
MENLYFLLINILSSVALVALYRILLCNNPLYAVFYMILMFFSLCSILLLFKMDFLAILFLMIYIGAIAVLVLFVVMTFTLDLKIKAVKIAKKRKLFYVFLMVFLLSIAFIDLKYYPENLLNFFPEIILPVNLTNLKLIGLYLYTHIPLNLILGGILLLVSMVGVITLTLNKKGYNKRQQLRVQLFRKPTKHFYY